MLTGHISRDELRNIRDLLQNEGYGVVKKELDAYVKAFEVRKRIYTEYDKRWRPVDRASFDQMDLYLILAECCLLVYRETRCMKYLSCLLKIDDTLLSVQDKMTMRERARLKEIIEQELEEVSKLGTSLLVEGMPW